MLLPEFSAVRLTTDRYVKDGVGRGAIGFILDVGESGYLVEFSRPDGTTIALLFLGPDDVELAPDVMPTAEQLVVER